MLTYEALMRSWCINTGSAGREEAERGLFGNVAPLQITHLPPFIRKVYARIRAENRFTHYKDISVKCVMLGVDNDGAAFRTRLIKEVVSFVHASFCAVIQWHSNDAADWIE